MTELIWDGKYKYGKKVMPVRIALPFQTIETINKSAQRQKILTFPLLSQTLYIKNGATSSLGGNKKYVLPSLRQSLQEK